MNISSGWIAGVASAAVVAAAHGQCEPEIVRTIPGAAYSTVIEGSLAYVAGDGAGLRILDISDPYEPVQLGHIETPRGSRAVAVSSGVAYVANELREPTLIIDVSDPTNPRLIETLVLPRPLPAVDVAVQGNTLYIAIGEPGAVLMYDVSDRANPAFLQTISGPGKTTSVEVTGTRMYMTTAAGGGVQIVDVRDPRAPAILWRQSLPSGAWAAAVRGSILYLPYGQHPAARFLEILDVSDPTSPVRRGIVLFTPPGVDGIAAEIVVARGAAVIAGGPVGDLRIVDVGVFPPRVIGSMPTPGGRCLGVAVAGSVAYVADANDGLHVVDISSCLPCFADCDRSGSIDFADFLCFNSLFLAEDHRADCDESGSLDFFDYLCFQSAFAAGCE